MNTLLDTHMLLWFAWGDKRLIHSARSIIEDIDHTKYVSMASIWEMAIKLSLGKLKLAKTFEEFLIECIDDNGFEILPIKRAHSLKLVSMEFHHRDPLLRGFAGSSFGRKMRLPGLDIPGIKALKSLATRLRRIVLRTENADAS